LEFGKNLNSYAHKPGADSLAVAAGETVTIIRVGRTVARFGTKMIADVKDANDTMICDCTAPIRRCLPLKRRNDRGEER
jgi:hypothetical protein